MEGGTFHGVPFLDQNYRQLMTASRRRMESAPGISPLIGCQPWNHTYIHMYKQQNRFSMLGLCICAHICIYLYICKYICSNNNKRERGYQLLSVWGAWEGLEVGSCEGLQRRREERESCNSISIKYIFFKNPSKYFVLVCKMFTYEVLFLTYHKVFASVNLICTLNNAV